ncbi:phage virion morphogenesis protein [uncultured Draconibacterium sp.]|uniref:phage virion morphogenesis protein n=1 Tax=uncultured Draconibacterium sp. TaxID=1573823 RepID=UPI0025D75D91|nr:phage virion morphogenesis protein [uncultured Draconibacterium sp.]
MSKNINDLPADLAKHQKALAKYIRNDAPRIVGKMGVDHFKENFDKEGFVNNGLQKWPERKTDTGRKTLTGETRELQDSIDYKTDIAKTSWGTDKVYGSIHNRGGKTKAHTIRPRAKKGLKFMGKGGAVIRKKVNHPGSNIPQRQFIGHSKELIEKVNQRIEKDVTKILNK